MLKFDERKCLIRSWITANLQLKLNKRWKCQNLSDCKSANVLGIPQYFLFASPGTPLVILASFLCQIPLSFAWIVNFRFSQRAVPPPPRTQSRLKLPSLSVLLISQGSCRSYFCCSKLSLSDLSKENDSFNDNEQQLFNGWVAPACQLTHNDLALPKSVLRNK